MAVQANEIVNISFPLSISQQSVWLHQKMNLESNAYNIPVLFSIDNTVSHLIIENAIQFVIHKYDILRAQFLEIDGSPSQVICNLENQFSIEIFSEIIDLNNELKKFVNQTFNIEKAPLFRFAIIGTLKEEKFVLMVFHHLISDGTSLYLLAQEIRQTIACLKKGETPPENVNGIGYCEFVKLEREYLKTNEILNHKKYWQEKLHGASTYLTLPYDFKFEKYKKTSASKRLLVSDHLRKQLEAIAEKSHSSLYPVLLSGFIILLHRLTGEQDIIIGSPIINRNSKITASSQGFFLNTTMLRNHVNPATSISQFIKKTQSTLFQALRHRAYPFSYIINDLKIKSEANKFPFSNIFFNGLTFFDDVLKEEAFEAFSDDFGLDMNFDLDCYVTYSKEKLMIRLDYREALFKEETIELYLQKYCKILEQICVKYNQPIYDIAYRTPIAPITILNNAPWYNPSVSIAEVFYQQAKKYAQRIAIKTATCNISYHQLNELTNQYANYLLNFTTDTRVAICVSHGQNMAIAVLSALKAGITYIPLDPAYPDTRKVLLLKDAQASIIIADNETAHELIGLQNVTVVNLDNASLYSMLSKQNLPPVTSHSPAYIMYTSGSTGKPKGVLQLHKNVLHFISQYTSALHIDCDDVVTGFSPITYDSFNNDCYGALLNGAAYCPLSLKDNILNIGEWIIQNEITIWHSVPSVFRMYVQEWILTSKRFLSIRIMKMTGELVRLDDFENFKKITHKKAKFVVSLGSTEATLSCINLFNHNDNYYRQVMPVGYPIAETQALIVNDSLEELDVLEPGEILIVSDFITPGYENNPTLNQIVFSNKEGKRSYLTGDLGRKLPDGKIEWIARKDDQLKINGIRIEPGEIENHLLSFPGIKEALVINKEFTNGQKCLCAYYTGDKEVPDSELISYLSDNIPLAIIPAYFTRLEKFSYNMHGKLDKKALPEPIAHGNKEFIAPRNDMEEKLCRIFAEVLDIEYKNISAEDSFFELGGHSLKAIQLIHRLHKAFNKRCELKDVFTHPTVATLAEMVKIMDKDIFKNIVPLSKHENYELSHAQLRLWILSKLTDTSVAYHISNAVEIKGAFDIEIFQKVMLILIERHEILRTIFIEIEGTPMQKVKLPYEVKFNIGYEDVSNDSNKTERAHELINKESVILFDYSKAPLMRALLIKLEEDKHVLLLTLHHIISDGWSMEVFINEIRLLYEALKKGIAPNLPALTLQYKDYAAWHNNLLQSKQIKRYREYWLKQFEGKVPVLDMPTDKPRPAIQTYNGDQLSFKIPAELTSKLKEFSLQHDATLFMTLLALIKTLLFRYTGQNDLVIGTVMAGRDHIDLESQLGFYVNTLALRTRFKEDDTFEQLIKKVKDVTLGAFEHGLYTFDYLVDDLNITRDLSRSPLFDIMVVLQNERTRTGYITGFEGLNLSPFSLKHVISKFDFTFNIVELGDIIRIDIEYNNDLYTSERVKILINHFLSITEILLNHSGLKINSFNYLTEKEEKFLIEEVNKTETPFPQNKTIITLFEEQVALTPEAIAVIFKDKRLTYKELNSKANNLGKLLIDKGIQPDNIVAIMAERSIEMIIGIYGILKSGGAYLPIDPNSPEARKKYMLENSKVTLLVTQGNLINTIDSKIEKINLDDENIYKGENNNIKNNKPNNIAYVIYTSGSTGNPKGVIIEHQSLVNRLHWMQKKYPIGSSDTILQKTPYTFDVSLWEIFWWSIAGSKVCMLVPEGEKEPKTIINAINAYHITILHFVPSMLNLFLEEVTSDSSNIQKISNLKQIFTSGEALLPNQVEKFNNSLGNLNSTKLTNLYGPTEATVDVTYYDCPSESPITQVPIGKPIDNIKLYIINKEKQIQPIGVAGELCIGGLGLARGYLFNEELTENKFITNPFGEGRLYLTGDLTKWLPDGNVAFLGRLDHQVKIRGNRIELGEIESALTTHAEIKEAVVIARGLEGEKYLCAYIVTQSEVSTGELRSFLSTTLPEYMLPSYFVKVTNMPLTPNGKIDRKALPEPEIQKGDTHKEPCNETERKLVEIWSEVLKIESDKISTNKSFFELGGHSLKAITILGKIHKGFNKQISLTSFFSNPTIKGIANLITGTLAGIEYKSIPKAEKKEYHPLSFTQRLMFLSQQLHEKSTAYNVSIAVEFIEDLEMEKLKNALHKLIERHEILRTSFHIMNTAIVQKIEDKAYMDIQCIESPRDSVKEIIKESIKPFDLNKFPPYRIKIFKVESSKYILLIDMHHIITDGSSIPILIKDLLAFYKDEQLSPLEIQYKDYVAWNNIFLKSEAIKKQEAYWLNKFIGNMPKMTLPYDFTRQKVRDISKAHQINFTIDTELTSKVKFLVSNNQTTLYSFLLSIFNILLHKYSGQSIIIVGSPVANRPHPSLANNIGAFINMIALKNEILPDDTFKQFLKKVSKITIEGFDNQDYQFEELLLKLGIKGETNRNPLFDCVFNLMPFENELKKVTDAIIKPFDTGVALCKFDLQFVGYDLNNTIPMNLKYSTELFKTSTAQMIIQHFLEVVQVVTLNSEIKIEEIKLDQTLVKAETKVNTVEFESDF